MDAALAMERKRRTAARSCATAFIDHHSSHFSLAITQQSQKEFGETHGKMMARNCNKNIGTIWRAETDGKCENQKVYFGGSAWWRDASFRGGRQG
jgi:hypothetical protein